MNRLKLIVFGLIALLTGPLWAADQVKTDKGTVEGIASKDSKIRVFLGIPYAAPPVGDLRWKPPQPAVPWTGVKQCDRYGKRAMQVHVWDDMFFRDNGPSEDCLYLNVWTPAKTADEKLPVMVWIHGGGFIAGASSEPRQEGENMARKGVVVVTLNYRMGVFGFLALPELAEESPAHAAGNYGLMDMVAALEWVQKNITAFGGDPKKVTIFGESAGSFAVSGLMASPRAKGLFQRAIGESGALFGSHAPDPLEKAEAKGLDLAKKVGAKTLEDLRAKPADELLQASMRDDKFRFGTDVDGDFLPKPMEAIYAKGQQNHVPLLAGWNKNEGGADWILGTDPRAAKAFAKKAQGLFGDKAGEFLKLYPASDDTQAKESAGDYAGDHFIGFSTWKWIEGQVKTGHAPVYRYEFDQALPPAEGKKESPGAYHSSEIEFVFGNLASKKLPWRAEDWKVSDLMADYWTNFAKTGNPNGPGLPQWPRYNPKGGYPVMHLSAHSESQKDPHRGRYLFLDKVETKE